MTAPAGYDTDGMLGATVREKLQYEKMATARYRDQHGRVWTCEIDKGNLHPCTPLTPAGWRAPTPLLVPPPKYLKVTNIFGELLVDYDHWLTDVNEARREFDMWVREVAIKMYKGAAMEMIRAGDGDLRAAAGVAPMSPEFVRAMKSGVSKWVLGIPRPDGTPYPMPAWAAAEMHTLAVVETWDGSDADLSVDPTKYADEEPDEDAQERADRWAAAQQYGDVEEAVDPHAAQHFQPLPKRGRGRPPKVRE